MENEGVGRDWDPEKDLAALTMERDVTGKDEVTIAKEVMRDAAPLAARAIAHIALYSLDERKRLDAAKYIVDRNLGRIGEEKVDTEEVSPLEKLLADDIWTVEQFANEGGK